MTHADAFLQDILAHPDDDAPRLIFADWLEEQGDPNSIARAEFIRIQCALAGGQLPEQRRTELVRRENQILNEWDEEWVRPIRRLVKNWEFHRGFIHYIGMSADKFLSRASQLFRHAPIQHLRLTDPSFRQVSYSPIGYVAALADSQYLRRLRSLDLSENDLGSPGVRALVVSKHLTCLTELNLSHNRIGNGGIWALASSPLLGRLECLNLCGNDIGAGGLRALADALEKWEHSPEGLRLTKLELFIHLLSDAGQRVIAGSPLLRQLVR
ncbi:MAG TPA: TIGR02996 domain-containing protein [Gemmataceae bacterium]|nr:TIGR02996 domain-containing protein [Gemmataceae bacterium]